MGRRRRRYTHVCGWAVWVTYKRARWMCFLNIVQNIEGGVSEEFIKFTLLAYLMLLLVLVLVSTGATTKATFMRIFVT